MLILWRLVSAIELYLSQSTLSSLLDISLSLRSIFKRNQLVSLAETITGRPDSQAARHADCIVRRFRQKSGSDAKGPSMKKETLSKKERLETKNWVDERKGGLRELEKTC